MTLNSVLTANRKVNSFTQELIVAHSVSCWLPITMGWIHTQLKFMEQVRSIVLADTTQDVDSFYWSPVYHDKLLNHRHLYTLLKISRKLGIRWHPSVYDTEIQTNRAQLLHSHFGDKGWFDLPLVRKHELKHVVTFYGYDLHMLPTQQPIWRKRYQELFACANLFLCEGPYMADVLINLGCPQKKVRVQKLGVDLDTIPYMPRSIGADGLVKILIAGSFREKKGIPDALEAIGRLYPDHPNLRVTIIGDAGADKREKLEKERILNVIERFGLQSIVRLLGFQPHHILMREAYEHHIFLSPSILAANGDTEGGAPVTIIEMSASGMPIISTTHCDIPNIVQNHQSGLLVPERDPVALANALKQLIANPELIATLGNAGRKHMQVNHNSRTQANRLSELYCQVLAQQ